MQISDDMLMAYADGELSASDRARIDAVLAGDPALQDRIEGFRASRRAVAGAFLRPAPQPDLLANRIRALSADAVAPEHANVVALPVAVRRSVPLWQLPVAASLALAVGLASAGLWQRGAPSTGSFAALADPDLDRALSSLASGTRQDLPQGGQIVVIASFAGPDGKLCREFEMDRPDGATIVAVACHGDSGWSGQLAVAAASGAEGYAPASSLETLDAWMAATGAAEPLSAEAESLALAGLAAGP